MTVRSPASDAVLSRSAAVLLLVFVILVWGINWPAMKFGLRTMAPFTFSAIRLVLGALTLFLVLALRGGIRLPSRHDMPVVLSVGLGQIGAFLAFITLALQHVDAGRSAILSYTTPIWVVPAAVIFLRERLGFLTACGLALGLFGIAALFNPWQFDWSDRDALIGNGYLLLAAFTWAGALLHVKVHTWHASALELAPWQLVTAAVPLAVLAVLIEHDAWQPLDRATALVLAYNGPLSTAFAIWAWLTVNRALPAITSSLASLGVPVVGLIASVMALGERLDLSSIAGLALISGGLILVSVDSSASVKQTTT
jgi:drug/metabolite transporter (DMT)-like permease